MEQLLINVDTKLNAHFFLRLVKSLNFVKGVNVINEKTEKNITKGTFKSKDAFLKLCGIWQGKNITLKKIRDKAWRKIAW